MGPILSFLGALWVGLAGATPHFPVQSGELAAAPLEQVWELPAPPFTGACRGLTLQYSPDGRSIVTAGGRYLVSWSVQTGEPEWTTPTGVRYARAARYLGHGRELVVGDDRGEVFLVDASVGTRIRTVGALGEWVTEVAVSRDDSLVAAVGFEGRVAMWTTAGDEVPLPEVRASRLEGLALSPDGRWLVVAGQVEEGTAGIVQAIGLRSEESQVAHGSQLAMVVRVTDDSERVAIGYLDGTLELRSLPDLELVWSAQASPHFVGSLDLTGDGRGVLVGSERTLARFDLATGHRTELVRADQLPRAPGGLAVSPDGAEVAVLESFRGRFQRLALPSMTALDDPTAFMDLVDSLTFSPDGQVVAASSRYSKWAVFLSARTGEEVARVAHPGQPGWGIDRVAFDPGGSHVLLSSTKAHEVAVLRWPGLEPVAGLHEVPTMGLAWFSPEERYLAVVEHADADAVRVYDLDTGVEVADPGVVSDLDTVRPSAGQAADLPLASQSTFSALLSRLSRPGDGLRFTYPQPPEAIHHGWSGGFTADGRGSAAVRLDHVIEVSQLGTVVAGAPLEAQAEATAIDPTGRHVAVSLWDGRIRMYRVPDLAR